MSDIYDWKKALTWLEDSVRSTYVDTSDFDRAFDPWIDRLASYIERLEAERDALLAELESFAEWAESYPKSVWHEPNADELKAAHDALKAAGLDGIDALSAMLYRHALKNIGHRARAAIAAYDNAERVLRGE